MLSFGLKLVIHDSMSSNFTIKSKIKKGFVINARDKRIRDGCIRERIRDGYIYEKGYVMDT